MKSSMRTLKGGVNLNNGIDFVDPETGFTPLMVATMQGKVQVVRALIDRGAELEYQEQDKLRTALIIAANYGKAECVEEILKRGALINAIDKYEMTALMHASKHGHKDCVAILLNRGASPNKADDHGFTAMHLAAKFGHVNIVEQLFEKGATLEIRDLVEGKTPLHIAAQYGRKETVKCLLDREAKINRRSTFDKSTALMLASKEGHKSTASLLISRGADANLVDLYGWAPLHFAASWGRKDTALILIVEGNADVNSCETTAKGEGGTPPLIVAAKGSHKEIIKLLLQYGADVNYPEMHHGHTALAAAAEVGLPEVVQLLLDYGANINYKNHITGTTALMMAAKAGRRGAIVSLLNNLADINILDNRAWNALMHAEKAGFRDVLLSAIVHLTPFAKVNLVPWIEMECPHMVRGSLGGSPAVFLNGTLYTHHGLYNGLRVMPSDADVYLLYCLVMLAAACQRGMHNHSYDAPELRVKLAHIDAMLCNIVKARSMCIDAVFNDCFTLGHKPVATLGRYRIKYFASAFTTGPLALYMENGLTALLATPQMREKIDRSFWACLRDDSPSVGKILICYACMSSDILRSRPSYRCPSQLANSSVCIFLFLTIVWSCLVTSLQVTTDTGRTCCTPATSLR
jgi:ankyrin repeat protein